MAVHRNGSSCVSSDYDLAATGIFPGKGDEDDEL